MGPQRATATRNPKNMGRTGAPALGRSRQTEEAMANRLVGSLLIISAATISGYQHLSGHVVMDSIFFAPLAIVGALLVAAGIYERG